MKQKKAYKYRIYPTDEQKQMLAQTFGCCRYVYNWALRERTDAYYKRGERLYYEDTAQRLVLLKKQEETSWLNEVSSVPLQQALRHLDRAFRTFFEGRADYPTFKKKRHHQSATYASNAFSWNGQALTLAKMDESLAIVLHRPLPNGCKPSSVTVTKDCANRYFVSILVEEDIKALEVTPRMVGLDLGLKSMVITSDGHTYGNPKFLARDEKKLAKAQRRHAKKKKGSKNRNKARLKVARIHARITDRRRDYQHKLSTKIIRENQIVCVESLQVRMSHPTSLVLAHGLIGLLHFPEQFVLRNHSAHTRERHARYSSLRSSNGIMLMNGTLALAPETFKRYNLVEATITRTSGGVEPFPPKTAELTEKARNPKGGRRFLPSHERRWASTPHF